MKKPIIGVFDSGIGGKSVANAIKDAYPKYQVIFTQDKANLPYGNKSASQLYELVLPILKRMEAEGCTVIVIACNSVTTTIIHKLRRTIKVPLIGIEPMIKPAAGLTLSGVVAVCATPTTLKSERYKFLKETYAANLKVIEPDCSDWAQMIEDNTLNKGHIAEIVDNVTRQGADVIVMGCTHYHWIEREVQELAAGRATVIQPEQAIIKRLSAVLEQLT